MAQVNQATIVTMQANVLKDAQATTLLAALVATLVDWDNSEERTGRRGEYHTTGANSLRLREVEGPMLRAVCATLHSVGVDCEESDIAELLDGRYEFQISFAANRFSSKSQRGLSATEMRALDRAAQIMDKATPDKLEQIAKVLHVVPRKAA